MARELAEAGEVQEQGRIVPLRVRWALIMALVVAVTMSITAAFIYQKQYRAMMDQVTGYGASLAKFMATQNAVPLLTEDWAATEVFIQSTINRQDFAYRLNGPLRVLRNSLDELAKGRYDYRIAEKRNDEFGELYSAFDATATTLQQRHERTPDRPAA